MSSLLSFLLKCVSYIPFGVIYVISDCLYYILYYVVRYRRKVVRKNLTESFPEKNMQEIKSIEKKFYSYFVDQILETCKLATISPEEISRRMKFTNAEAVNAVFRSDYLHAPRNRYKTCCRGKRSQSWKKNVPF